MDSYFIFFLTVSIINFLVIQPKEVPQEWAYMTYYTSWGWTEFFRKILLSICFWFIGFYLLLTLIYDFHSLRDDLETYYDNKDQLYADAFIYGTPMIILGLFLSDAMYAVISYTLLALLLTHIIIPCDEVGVRCYLYRGIFLLVTAVLFKSLFAWISAPVRLVLTTLAEHLIIGFTMTASVMCISSSFERWQREDKSYAPILAGIATAIPRGIYSWLYHRCTCCHREQILERIADFAERH